MNKMKKYIIGLLVLLFAGGTYFISSNAQSQKPVAPTASQAQTPFLTPEEKRELRKNLVVKEWNTDAKGKRKWMDHLTVWNENGFKLEEIEYAVYGQKERVTFEYDELGKCVRENVYNDKNKLYRIRKYEYLENGRKKMQYNYNPDGKLYSTKIYEYTYK
jgi:antitoxin component YwqK of YwqJK toxin-antitoxin module